MDGKCVLFGMRIPTDRYDWAVLYLCIATLTCSLPIGIGELWLGSGWLLSMLFFPLAMATVFFGIVALVRRERPLRVLAYLAGSAILCCVTLNQNLAAAIEIKYFERNKDRYDKSVTFLMSDRGKKRALTEPFSDLTYDGVVRYYQDPDNGNEFLVYRKVYDGIDNGFGYIWSKSDISPESVPFYAPKRVTKIGRNWFYARFT